jgi:Cu2+-exporting ATPase
MDHTHHRTAEALEHGAMHGRSPRQEPAPASRAHGGHGGHGDHAAVFRDRFWLTLALAVPVVVFSDMFQRLLNYTAPTFPGIDWVSPVLGTVIFLYGGWPFLTGAVSEARWRQPGMMLLIGLAITVAFVASWMTETGAVDLDFWWELAALIAVMLLGHWLEMRAVGQASGALEALATLLPDQAERVRGDRVESVPLDSLEVGDVVLVRSGARVPADGVVVEGVAELDESMLTGESRPVPKGVGDRVVAGTVSTDSAIRVRVDAVGEDTALAGIRRLVEEAQSSRSRAQALADRAAAALFYVATATGIVTFLVWSLLGVTRDAIERTVTVLVIACPHALGLAIPLVIAISTALSARSGILVKDRLSLERMRQVDVVLFDKTGTLTTGRPAAIGAAAVDRSEGELLRSAAAVEADSEHPLARAVVAAAEQRGSSRVRASSFRSLTGRGVEATVDGSRVAVGGPSLLRDRSLEPPTELKEPLEDWRARGATVLYVVEDGKVVGALALADAVRPESKEAVRELRAQGIEVAMITGDAHQVAEAVAVGIAIGAGTDVAIESAGVVLASDDPRAVLDVIRLSRATYRKMVQNLAWATGYNLFALPVAAGVFAWAGVSLDPAIAALLMSVSTIVVALNAQLLRGLELGR